MHTVIHFFLTLDQHLITLISNYGLWAYGLLFLILFCETGLIITPFLPGDSLLFIAGGLSSRPGSALVIGYLFLLLVLASCLGNQVNYQIGRWVGPRVFSMKHSWIFNQKHLRAAHDFYEQYGKMTILLARFMPIVRTFAPFIAGVADMNKRLFTWYNILSAILWVGSLLTAGYMLGQVAFIQKHLNVMIYGIIACSLLPSLLAYFRHSRARQA